MIAHITISTSRLQESLDFYQWLLQLPIDRRLPRPEGDIVFLGENETKLELIEDAAAERITAKGLSIGFTVQNLNKKLALLDSKQIPHSGIIAPAPGVRFAFVIDPNGCAIQLFEQKH